MIQTHGNGVTGKIHGNVGGDGDNLLYSDTLFTTCKVGSTTNNQTNERTY